MATEQHRALLSLFLLQLIVLISPALSDRAVIDVSGGSESVVWAVQLSDLHFSVFHPQRANDFRRLVGPALSMINPSLVLITGDLTDGKSIDHLIMKQEEAEWMEYQGVMDDVIKSSGLDMKIFYDLRGNHDKFGVPEPGGKFDFYQKYSINAAQGRNANVQSVTLQNNGWKHLFVGFDSAMEIGLRGPTNLFGHPSDQILKDLDLELAQWDSDFPNTLTTKITFGHFPLSFTAPSETGKILRDVFLKHKVATYLCGHLHTSFGKNLKRHHQSVRHFLSSGKYYQYNLHEGVPPHMGDDSCSYKSESTNEFWEWEMGDWRKNRMVRIVAIDSGYVSFVDVSFKLGPKQTIILPTFPLDSRFMQRISSSRDYLCQRNLRSSSYDTIRTLIFSKKEIVSVSVKIYDSRPGELNLVFDSVLEKLEGNGTRGDLYSALWNWRAFVDPSPDRYWLQIEAIDNSRNVSYSQLRPFSVNGLTASVKWTWREFWVMGIQWASFYQLVLWSVVSVVFSMLLIPRAYLLLMEKHYMNNNLNSNVNLSSVAIVLFNKAVWMLMELSKVTSIWLGLLLYLIYLVFFPWFSGHVFTSGTELGSMTHKGWVMGSTDSYLGVPDVMVIVIPHMCLVVLPTVLLIAAMMAEKVAYRSHYLSLSGKKKDDYCEMHSRSGSFTSALSFWRGRWLRKVLLLFSLAILWKHGKSCRGLVKAYEMNPFIHSPVYCFAVPVLLAFSIYKTSASEL